MGHPASGSVTADKQVFLLREDEVGISAIRARERAARTSTKSLRRVAIGCSHRGGKQEADVAGLVARSNLRWLFARLTPVERIELAYAGQDRPG